MAVTTSHPTVPTRVRLSEVLSGLSYALDLTEGQREGHAVRACLIGMRLADLIGMPHEQRLSLFYALLMKDLGCTSNAARFAALFGADDQSLKSNLTLVDWTEAVTSFRFVANNVAPGAFWLRRVWQALGVFARGPEGAREVVRTRCERGADIARMLGFSSDTASAIRSIDEHWDGRGQPYALRGAEIPVLGRVVGFAQTFEVFLSSHGPAAAYEMARARSGSWFEPMLVDALTSIEDDASFWSALRRGDLARQIACIEPADDAHVVDEAQLDVIADAFARVIDAKSPWTYRHSNGVAEVAVAIGRIMGLPAGELRELRRAALLHDLGKLGISNLILDKPGRLTANELATMRWHPTHTYAILNRVGCFRHLADVAAAHHERMDGRGYHRGLGAGELPLDARILVVADIADALRASRPYREGLPTERMLAVMRRDIGTGIDADCYHALEHVITAAASDASSVPAVQLVPALAEDYTQAA